MIEVKAFAKFYKKILKGAGSIIEFRTQSYTDLGGTLRLSANTDYEGNYTDGNFGVAGYLRPGNYSSLDPFPVVLNPVDDGVPYTVTIDPRKALGEFVIFKQIGANRLLKFEGYRFPLQ